MKVFIIWKICFSFEIFFLRLLKRMIIRFKKLFILQYFYFGVATNRIACDSDGFTSGNRMLEKHWSNTPCPKYILTELKLSWNH